MNLAYEKTARRPSVQLVIGRAAREHCRGGRGSLHAGFWESGVLGDKSGLYSSWLFISSAFKYLNPQSFALGPPSLYLNIL